MFARLSLLPLVLVSALTTNAAEKPSEKGQIQSLLKEIAQLRNGSWAKTTTVKSSIRTSSIAATIAIGIQ